MTVFVELDDDTKHISITCEWRFSDLCKTVPGSRWDAKKKVWVIPTSWSGCLALRSTFKDNLEIGPKLTDWAIHERVSRIDPANALRAIESLDRGDPKLYPHQRAGVEFLAAAKAALLADEPGLGKTAQAIRGLAELQKKGNTVFPALVVCPSSLKLNWQREFAMWWPGVETMVIAGTALQRRKQFDRILNPKPGETIPLVVIMNWESLRGHSRLAPYGNLELVKCVACGGENPKISATRCEMHILELNKIDFKSVIADEVHRAVNGKSKQARALWAASGDAENRFALTGTPLANDVLDLWAILHFLAPKEWPGKTRWRDRFVDSMMDAFGGTIVIGLKPDMEAEFRAAIEPRLRRILKSRVLPNLPEIIYEQRDIEMAAKQKRAYEQMRDNMIAELEYGFMTADSSLVKSGRLQQLATSYAEVEEDLNTGKMNVTLIEPSCTVDAVMEDILSGDFGDASIAITSVSKQLMKLLSARLTKAKIDHGLITGDQSEYERDRAVHEFQSGATKVVLFTAAVGGVGLTLTAASVLIRMERSWSLVDDTQVRDRVHRIGSEIHDSILVVDYLTKGTMQYKVREALDIKAQNFEEIVKDKDQLLDMLRVEKAVK